MDLNSSTEATFLLVNDTIANQSIPLPINPEFLNLSRFWVQRVLLPIIGTIGLFGNVVTIVVLTRRGMRSSTNTYLTALAIADFIYLVCVFWLSLKHYRDQDLTNMSSTAMAFYAFYAYTWPYSLWLTDATTNTSVWLTVTFTVERYIAVRYPIRGRLLCTESRARRVIATVYLICFTATLSTPFEWTVVELVNPATNCTVLDVAYSSLGNDEIYQKVYYWFTSITFTLLPLTLLIIFNSFLIQSVRQSQKLRVLMTHPTSDREERAASNEIRITVTLIAVVIMFLVCQLPTAATLIYKIFHEPTPHEQYSLLALGNIFNFLVSVNAACNFLLYCALSKKYRRTFIWTFCRCFYRRASPIHSMAFFNPSNADDCHSRQASFRVSRGSTPSSISIHAPVTTRSPAHHQLNEYAPASRRNTIYLSLPEGNGSTGVQTTGAASDSKPRKADVHSRRPSQQSTRSGTPSSCRGSAPSSRPCRQFHKWCPWQAATKPKNTNTNTNASNILIHISGADDAQAQQVNPSQQDVTSV